MAESNVTSADDLAASNATRAEAKGHFAKAVEEAKAGAQALGKEAQDRAGEYREKLHQQKDQWSEKGREKSTEAKDKAYDYANLGKAKASEAMTSLGKLVQDNAAVIDEKVGVQYGNFARSAGASIQDAAVRLDEKTLEDLGTDAREFVREKPALAVGIAVAAGYALARLFRR